MHADTYDRQGEKNILPMVLFLSNKIRNKFCTDKLVVCKGVEEKDLKYFWDYELSWGRRVAKWVENLVNTIIF